MLGRGRNLCAGDGFDGGTVTQRPDVAFVILQLQAGIDEQLAVLLVAIELLDYLRKCRWHSGDERLARISVPDCKIALSDVAAFSLSLRIISMPRFRKIRWAKFASVSDISGRIRSPA